METATFGAGCFWGVEEAFRRLEGVAKTAVGYTGGTRDNPTYEDVCSGRTGHAEAIRIEFDPTQVSYDQLLDLFWRVHDATQMNRQGPDIGTQYRSAVFYHSPEQEKAARESMANEQASYKHDRKIVTEIVPAATFWPAEDYHQQYFEKRGRRRFGLF